jgi:hypothetical protein
MIVAVWGVVAQPCPLLQLVSLLSHTSQLMPTVQGAGVRSQLMLMILAAWEEGNRKPTKQKDKTTRGNDFKAHQRTEMKRTENTN